MFLLFYFTFYIVWSSNCIHTNIWKLKLSPFVGLDKVYKKKPVYFGFNFIVYLLTFLLYQIVFDLV